MSDTVTDQTTRTREEPSAEDLLLLAYKGERPPAPDWFTKAVETPYRTGSVNVQGADVTYQQWSDPSKPGLLLVHGNGAHAHWWDFIAPFFAEDYNVVAATFSGMGDSEWRETYSFDVFAEELVAVSADAGLFAHASKPMIVAHSFGGIVALYAAVADGDRFSGALIVDSHMEPPGADRPGPPTRSRPNRIYPDLAAALARFRLAPPQPCDNHFAVDYIARHSVKPVTDENGKPGLTWKFDPFIFRKLKPSWDERSELELDTKCPIMFMRGARSILVTPEISAYMQGLQDPPVPMVTIPEAYHHVMLDQPLAFVSAVRGILSDW